MTSEDLTIPAGKYDFLWATHDRGEDHFDQPPLVVMIHGFPGDSRSYGDVFGEISRRAVKDGLHTLRFDMRGCGQSNKAARFFTLKTAHEDCMTILRWAEKTGYKKIILVAEGLGAAIAVTALVDAVRPKIAGLVMLWPILDMGSSWLGRLGLQAEAAESAGEDHIVLENANVGLDFIREIQTYNLTPLLSRVTMAVRVHHGRADLLAPADSQFDLLRQGAPTQDLALSTYQDGGHGLKNPGDRQELLAEIRAFFRTIR